MVAVCALGCWLSVTALLAALGRYGLGEGSSPASRPDWSAASRQLLFFALAVMVARSAARRTGLLRLAAPARSTGGTWRSLLTRFRLSLSVLAASLVVSFLSLDVITDWLVATIPHHHSVDLLAPSPIGRLAAALAVAWLPAIPFLASDTWRLLAPLAPSSVQRWHVPFVVVASLVALASVVVTRVYLLSPLLLPSLSYSQTPS